MPSVASAKVLRALKQARAQKIPVGRAWSHWDKWDINQRRHILRRWCHLSKSQINYFCTLQWFSLSLHVRKSLKMFFKKTPVVDRILGEMRYLTEEKPNATMELSKG